MTALGYPVQQIALAALVAGACWAFGGMVGVATWHALAELVRRRP